MKKAERIIFVSSLPFEVWFYRGVLLVNDKLSLKRKMEVIIEYIK